MSTAHMTEITRREFMKMTGYGLIGMFLPSPDHVPLGIIEGTIPEEQRITFADALPDTCDATVKYLPDECALYGGKVYQVGPTDIWWHWDGGETPYTKDSTRVQVTWNGLLGRTWEHDPVATQFSVGPDSVLQMLPMSRSMMIQGRVTNDRGIQDITQARSLGAIQIETTGKEYDAHPPLESQTATLVDLTIALMRQYFISFSQISGHLERSAGLGKPDPGIQYLKNTRVYLLRTLIARGCWNQIGQPSTWNFYKEVADGNGVKHVLTQSFGDFWADLSIVERDHIVKHFGVRKRRIQAL